MSLLPLRTINTIRDNINTCIDVAGFECDLFILNNVRAQEQDIYGESPAAKYNGPIATKVWVEWKPDQRRLRKLGIFVEGQTPLIAWIKNNKEFPEITANSYFNVPINYAPNDVKCENFELVDRLVRNMYNAIVVECWKIAPLRSK
jgi:hypothetical protein